MSLKVTDALRLSWGNVIGHKGRSAAVVLTVAVLFGLIMGVNFILDGLEKTLVEVSIEKTEGKMYVETSFRKSRHGANEVRLAERLEKYRGKRVGRVQILGFDGSTIKVVDMGVAKEFVDSGLLAEVPEGKIPVLMPEGGLEKMPDGMDGAAEMGEEIAEKFFAVGEYPVTADMSDAGYVTSAMRLPEGNWLGVITEGIYGNGAGYYPILIDDGSGKIDRYVTEKTQARREEELKKVEEMLAMEAKAELGEEVNEETQAYTEEDIEYFYELARTWEPEVREESVAVFEDYGDLKGYVLTDDTPEAKNLELKAFGAESLFGNVVDIVESFAYWRMMLRFFEIVLLVVAVVVAALSFAHLVDGDAATVALYRSMGASTGAIYGVYLLYLVELCLLAVVVCILIALGLAGIVAIVNAEGLGVGLQEFYMLQEQPRVMLIGFSKAFWRVVAMIMLVAPLTLCLTTYRFSAKHIAKKLKED